MELRILPLDTQEAFQIARRDSVGLAVGLGAIFLATALMKEPEASPTRVSVQGFAGSEAIYTVPAKYAGLTAFDDGDYAAVELIDTRKPEHMGQEYVFDFTHGEIVTRGAVYAIGNAGTPADLARDFASLKTQYCARKQALVSMGGPAGEACGPAVR